MHKIKDTTPKEIEIYKDNLYYIEPHELDMIHVAITDIHEIHSDSICEYAREDNLFGLKIIAVCSLLLDDLHNIK